MIEPDVLVGRPVDLDLTDPFEQLIAEKTFVYEGSTEGMCARCERPVWVGPEQRKTLDARTLLGRTTTVLCFRCLVAAHQAGELGEFDITSLGNTEPNPYGTPEKCPCGRPLHYPDPQVRAWVCAQVALRGPVQKIEVLGVGAWLVPRHFIALHGIRGADLAGVAERYGFKRAE